MAQEIPPLKRVVVLMTKQDLIDIKHALVLYKRLVGDKMPTLSPRLRRLLTAVNKNLRTIERALEQQP